MISPHIPLIPKRSLEFPHDSRCKEMRLTDQTSPSISPTKALPESPVKLPPNVWPRFEPLPSQTVLNNNDAKFVATVLDATKNILPVDLVQRVCACIVHIRPSARFYYHKNTVLSGGEKYSSSVAIYRKADTSYAFFPNGLKIAHSSKVKVSECAMLTFVHSENGVELSSKKIQLGAKHVFKLKIQDPNARTGLDVTRQLSSCSAVAKTYFQGIENGKLFSFMERYHGDMLNYINHIDSLGLSLNFDCCLTVAEVVAEAILANDAAGYVNRDYKLENLLVKWDGDMLVEVKVADHDLACEKTNLAALAIAVGTPFLTAPEITCGVLGFVEFFHYQNIPNDLTQNATARDIWLYGAILSTLCQFTPHPVYDVNPHPVIQLQYSFYSAQEAYNKQRRSVSPQMRFLVDESELNQARDDLFHGIVQFVIDEKRHPPASPTTFNSFVHRCLSMNPLNRPTIPELREFLKLIKNDLNGGDSIPQTPPSTPPQTPP